MSDDQTAREQAAAKFGLEKEELLALTDWCTKALESGALGWPGVFASLDVALRVKEEFFSRSVGLVVFGISLSRDDVPHFLDQSTLEADAEFGVTSVLRRGESPSGRGRTLGFDVLGWEHGGFHSYLCNGLEVEFARLLKTSPNPYGFFDRLDDARQCTEHCNVETTGAEPALWMPWRVSLYDGSLIGA